MKGLFLLIVLVGSVLFNGVAGAATVVPETPVSYSDGRPSPSYRLPSTDDGVMFEHGMGPGFSDVSGIRDAFLYEEAGTYYLTYDGLGPNYWSVNEATSTDLVNWNRLGKVLGHGPSGAPDDSAAAYGTIYKKPGGTNHFMFYLGAANKSASPENVPLPDYVSLRAKSTTGPTGAWVKQSTTPIIPLVNGSYREVTASPGPIIKSGDHYYMYFSAAAEHESKYYRGIGLAWTTDLNATTWSVGSGPIISIYEQVENASLYYQESDETWYMFVNHVGISASGNSETTDKVWVYWSDDPFNWNTDNKAVVMDETVSSWSTGGVIGIPTVVEKDGELKLIYDGRNPTDTSSFLNNVNRALGLSHITLPIVQP